MDIQLYRTVLQGPRTQIDAFQMNFFSWFNDILIKSQCFLEFWDREISYKTFSFCFINLTWPPRPQKEQVQKMLRDVGVALSWYNAMPLSFQLQEAE